jgi:hypothetical protein
MSTAFGTNTPTEPEGPQVLPGTYQVRLTAGGKTLTQSIVITMDPRVKVSPADLQQQFALEMKIYAALQQANQALTEIREIFKAGNVNEATAAKASAIAGIPRPGAAQSDQQSPSTTPTLTRLTGVLARLLNVVDSADAAPTTQATKAANDAIAQLQRLLTQWQALKPH